jgi:hypothetical protein
MSGSAVKGSQVPTSNNGGLEVFEGLDGGLEVDTSVAKNKKNR